MWILSIYFALYIVQILGQVPELSSCPNYVPVQNFSVEKYMGKWYEAERYFAIFEFGGKCVTANYNYDNGRVIVVNQQISALTGMQSNIEGVATVVGNGNEAKLSVRFPSVPFNFDAPYWVLDTDYDSYAVVWSCVDFGILSTRNAWILTRLQNPSLNTMEKAYAALDKFNVNRSYFIRTDQKNCTPQ